ncbi:hypothetical protein AMECASPLE_032119 [Ameca splendens]|uniref:Uncharacterized protein n=1 Tax=Ameca splendens TaxID=208324 RepID=A0ABV0XJI2_9TELE
MANFVRGILSENFVFVFEMSDRKDTASNMPLVQTYNAAIWVQTVTYSPLTYTDSALLKSTLPDPRKGADIWIKEFLTAYKWTGIGDWCCERTQSWVPPSFAHTPTMM